MLLQRYTEAILLCPHWPVLFINRALCHKQKGEWEKVERDSRKALDLDSRHMKVSLPLHYRILLIF